MAFRRASCRLGSTNRYTDGSGRKLDTNVIPKELFVQPISNRAYPSTTEHWQPVVAGDPSPYKGKVVISGGGVVGLTAAMLFGNRGWHVTVIEKHSDPFDETSLALPSHTKNPYQFESALVTRRAADALGYAGITTEELKQIGVKVTGVLDHPGSFNTWLTRGLTEHHRFAVNMLAVDVPKLRHMLDYQLRSLPSRNAKVFYDHKVVAVLPQPKKIIVKPLRDFEKPDAPPITIQENTTETSLSLNLKRMREADVEGVDYDLIVCAEGANSSLRDFLDVEGFASDREFVIRWFTVRSKALSREHIHRWLHKRKTRVVNLAAINTAVQTPVCIAFPKSEGEDLFALMAYFPAQEVENLTGEEFRRTYCPDIDGVVESTGASSIPFPMVHCEELYNSVGLPSAVMVGDAAHTCNPFLMQGLAMGLEDSCALINQVDALSRHFYDAVKQYSKERGTAGDSLREITERCLYYQSKKHTNPLLRFRNTYQHFMHIVYPRYYNEMFGPAQNHVYSRSIETMLNGRGYTSYEYAEKQQNKHIQFFQFGRLYT